MLQVKMEEREGKTFRFCDLKGTYNGLPMRVYLLPAPEKLTGVLRQDDIRPNELEQFIGKFLWFPDKKVAKYLIAKYSGIQKDVGSILFYAERQLRFQTYVQRLDKALEGFIGDISPEFRYARTDVTAFTMKIYADLDIGVISRKEAESQEKHVRDMGPGIIVLLRKERPS